MTGNRKTQTDFDPAEFDQAAAMAEEELRAKIADVLPAQKDGILYIAAWWEKWFMTAGHKRLGRVLVKLARGKADA